MPKRADKVRVEIQPFLDTYKGFLDTDLFFDILEYGFDHKYYNIPKDIYEQVLADKEKLDKFYEEHK